VPDRREATFLGCGDFSGWNVRSNPTARIRLGALFDRPHGPLSVLPAAFPQTIPRPSPPPVQLRDHPVRRDHRGDHAPIRRHEEVVARAARSQARRRSSIPQAVERSELWIADQGCDLILGDLSVHPALRAMPPDPRLGFRQEGGKGLAPGRCPRVRHSMLIRSRPTQGDKNECGTNGKQMRADEVGIKTLRQLH